MRSCSRDTRVREDTEFVLSRVDLGMIKWLQALRDKPLDRIKGALLNFPPSPFHTGTSETSERCHDASQVGEMISHAVDSARKLKDVLATLGSRPVENAVPLLGITEMPSSVMRDPRESINLENHSDLARLR